MNIKGETIQNGEPTPEHPVDIENKINLTGAIQILNKLKSKVTLVEADEKEYRLPFLTNIEQQAIETVLSELEKKDTEIIEAKEANRQLSLELEKKDEYIKMLTDERDTLIQERDYYKARYNELSKIVDSMAKHIYILGDYACLYEECDDNMDRECEDCIKEYFYKKVKETKDNGSTRGI